MWERRVRRGAAVVAAGLLCVACSETEAPSGAYVLTDFSSDAAFFDAPFPDEARRGPEGLVDTSRFPGQGGNDLVQRLVAVSAETPAFGTTSTIYFQTSAPLDATTVEQSYETSVEEGASVFVIAVDATQPFYGQRHPVEVRFQEDGGPFGTIHQLSLLPLQGMPLAPDVLYAAVVTSAVRGADGLPLRASPALEAVRAGARPSGMSEAAYESHRTALAALEDLGVNNIEAVAVFRTADATAEFRTARELALALPPPTVSNLALRESFPEYCVYEGTTSLPDFQRGELPYNDGGAWDLVAAPNPAEARVVVTIPRNAGAQIPAVLFSRTGGGGDRPLVDRGVRGEDGTVIEEGTGPALEFARVGFAGISIDGPHGGPRNPAGADEQFLIFNVQNPIAMRDNIRQSALELIIETRLIDELAIDSSECGGADVRFDIKALMGHSMGATIAPLAFAVEPRFEALILSGAGGSWIANIIHKESPVEVRPFAEILLGVTGRHTLTEHDPVLGLLQWAGESADPPVYAAALEEGERHVLMLQGIVDTYILPPMANATSLSFGLDLAGPALDADDERLRSYATLGARLDFRARERVELPVAGNQNGHTRVVVQHGEDPIEDGHEVVFQTDGPKQQYQCFLRTLASGTPTVPPVGGPCP
ncbi:MAG: hypothetical protein AAGF12_14000 [Myxococcota bacterium]